jgi:hypothetical protein
MVLLLIVPPAPLDRANDMNNVVNVNVVGKQVYVVCVCVHSFLQPANSIITLWGI